MSENVEPRSTPTPAHPTARTGSVFLRFLWMGMLPFLLLCAFTLADRPAWTLSLADAAYWAIAVTAIVARIIDVVVFEGLTAEGEPATRADLLRYVGVVAGASLILWVTVQSVGK